MFKCFLLNSWSASMFTVEITKTWRHKVMNRSWATYDSPVSFYCRIAESWRKLMCCNKTVDIIECTYMSGGHMVGKYSSDHQTRDTANSNQKGIKRGNECATTASNYRKTLLNVSVMLQCIANTAWSQVTLSVRQGDGKKRRRRRRRRSDREGEGRLLNSLGVPLPNRLLLTLSWTKLFSWFL